jgi:carbon-monoxide dehydrogenase small subunit
MKLTLSINGATHEVTASPAARLLDVLRGPLGLTGSKEGCGEGECGACTVLLDGDPVNACLVLAGQCQGRAIVTVEGLAAEGCLSPLQRAFIDHGGAQCGICTPGMLVSAQAYEHGHKSLVTLREAIAGNICRCTGYQRIVNSIEESEREPSAHTFGSVGSAASSPDRGA